jgi:hypothetical protein
MFTPIKTTHPFPRIAKVSCTNPVTSPFGHFWRNRAEKRQIWLALNIINWSYALRLFRHSRLVLLFLLAPQKKKKQKEKRLPDLSLRGSRSRLYAVGKSSIELHGTDFRPPFLSIVRIASIIHSYSLSDIKRIPDGK